MKYLLSFNIIPFPKYLPRNVTNERMKHDRLLYAHPTTSSRTTRVRESLGKVDGINEIPDSASSDAPAERNVTAEVGC